MVCHPACQAELRRGQDGQRVEQIQDGLGLRHRGLFDQLKNHPLDGLFAEGHGDQVPSLDGIHARRELVIEHIRRWKGC